MALIVITNPSPGTDIRANFDAAVAAAVDGDTLIALDGTFPFTGQANITKKIKLAAFNPAQATWNSITRQFSWVTPPSVIWYRSEATSDATLDGTAFIKFTQSTQDDCGIEVRGIHFKSRIPSYVGGLTSGDPASDGLSLAVDTGLYFEKCVNFKVTQCQFSYFGDSGVKVKHWDANPRGLISLNFFEECAKGWEGGGLGYGVGAFGEDLVWQASEQYGTDNFLFIENNKFTYARHSVATGGCGKVVFRNNEVLENKISISTVCHPVDSHSPRGTGLGTGNHFGTFAIEAYDNNITNTKYWSNTGKTGDTIVPGTRADDLIKYGLICRGGGALYHGNWINGYKYGVGIYVDATPFGTTYPLPYCLGHNTSRLHVWNNTFTPFIGGTDWAGLPNSTMVININNGIYQTEYFQENRDYFLTAPSSYTPYTYPHPNSDLAITPPVGTPFRTYKSRTFKSR